MSNGEDREMGRIEEKLDNHTLILDEIKKTMFNINIEISQHKSDINGVGIKTGSTQNELTEHKKDHKAHTGYVLTGAAIIATVFTAVAKTIMERF